MQKYEYKLSDHANEIMLNEYGIEGWKVVGTIITDGCTEQIIFMRERQQ